MEEQHFCTINGPIFSALQTDRDGVRWDRQTDILSHLGAREQSQSNVQCPVSEVQSPLRSNKNGNEKRDTNWKRNAPTDAREWNALLIFISLPPFSPPSFSKYFDKFLNGLNCSWPSSGLRTEYPSSGLHVEFKQFAWLKKDTQQFINFMHIALPVTQSSAASCPICFSVSSLKSSGNQIKAFDNSEYSVRFIALLPTPTWAQKTRKRKGSDPIRFDPETATANCKWQRNFSCTFRFDCI